MFNFGTKAYRMTTILNTCCLELHNNFYIKKLKLSAECPGQNLGNFCYWSMTWDGPKSFTQAQQKCRTLGGTLPVLSRMEDINLLRDYLPKTNIDFTWLGAKRLLSEWRFPNGKFKFSNTISLYIVSKIQTTLWQRIYCIGASNVLFQLGSSTSRAAIKTENSDQIFRIIPSSTTEK